MTDLQSYQRLADAVLLLHLGVVVFVVGGLLVVWIGNPIGWHWVNHRWFRLAHLAAIVFVVLQAWLGATCPLTSLEDWLRGRAGQAGYNGGFIEHWVHAVLFYQAPWWVFAAAYTAFFVAVVASWLRYPPAPAADRRDRRHPHV